MCLITFPYLSVPINLFLTQTQAIYDLKDTGPWPLMLDTWELWGLQQDNSNKEGEPVGLETTYLQSKPI